MKKQKMTFVPITDNCYICGKEFLKQKYNQTRCETCRELDLRKCIKHGEIMEPNKKCVQCCIEASHIKYTNENKYYWEECVCGYRAADLNTHIKNQHKDEEYYSFVKKHNIKIKSDYLCDKVKGENNPGYQHGGKLSSLSDKFIYADKVDKKEISNKISKSNRENGNTQTTLTYWLKECDGDIDLACKKLSERQTTFSLEKCIDKHGEKRGVEIWNKRQEKWLQTLNNKSIEELEQINRKKSNQMSFNLLWKNQSNLMGTFYILDIGFDKIKIGITSKGVKSRYGNKLKYIIIKEYKSTISHCFQVEQLIKKYYKEYGIKKQYQVSQFGYTESFDNSIKDLIVSFCDEHFCNELKTTQLFKEQFKLTYEQNF